MTELVQTRLAVSPIKRQNVLKRNTIRNKAINPATGYEWGSKETLKTLTKDIRKSKFNSMGQKSCKTSKIAKDGSVAKKHTTERGM